MIAAVRRTYLLFSVVLLLASPTADVRAETGVTDDEIRIGSCGVLSGPAKDLGIKSIEGANAYLNSVNDGGGLFGRKIKLVSLDDEYNPEVAIQCFKKLQDSNIFAGAVFAGAPTSVKYAQMAELNEVPIIGFLSGSHFLFEPFKRYVIPVRGSYQDEVSGIIDHLWDDAKLRRFAIIYQSDALGSSVLEGAKQTLAKHRVTSVAIASVPRDATDVSAAVQAIRAADPQVVILGMSFGVSPIVVHYAASQGWKPLFATTPRGGDPYIKMLGKEAEGTIFSQAVPPVERTDLPSIALYHKLSRRYFPKSKPNLIGLEGFAYAMVLVEGIKRAGNQLDRKKLVDAIEGMQDVDLGFGPALHLHYSKRLHKGFQSVYYTVVKGGRAVDLSDWKQFSTSHKP